MSSEFHFRKAPVIDLFTGQTLESGEDRRIVRLSPEHDGLSMLYCNDANPGKTFKLKIIAWGLQRNGKVVGLVPWLNCVTSCQDLSDPLNGRWEGYFNASNGQIFFEPPAHKSMELEAAHNFYKQNSLASRSEEVLQEIPDNIGTHAVFADKASKDFHINAIFSWQLYGNGRIEGMLIDAEKIRQTPVLAGDQALYPAHEDPNFRYFFQYGIANKIKTNDPEALKAISLMIKL